MVRWVLRRLPTWGGKDRLGEFLIKQGITTREQIAEALEFGKDRGLRLGSALLELDCLNEATLADLLSDRFGLPSMLATRQAVELDAVRLLPFDFLEERQILPVRKTDRSLTLAMVDPGDRATLKELRQTLKLEIRPVVAPQSTVLETLARLRNEHGLDDSLFVGSPEEKEALKALFAHLEDFEAVSAIATGGFATVYKCYQRSLDRPVAIKTIHKKKVPYEPIVERFMEEGKIIAKLDHRNIVRVIRQGEFEDLFYIIMEYVDGTTLSDALEHRTLKSKVDVLVQVADALSYSHSRGVLHRDIKPSNILVDDKKVVKVLDFGIAHFQDHLAQGQAKVREDFVLGTPRYMAPEQRRGLEFAEALADLYSVGAVMFEVFTGSRQAPTDEIDPREINPEIPRPLAQAIRRCLAPSPQGRLPNMATLREFLSQFRERMFASDPALCESLNQVESEDESTLFHDRYDLLSELKSEKDCRVLLAEHRQRGQLLLIREVRSLEGVREAQILSRSPHPNIGEILGVGTASDRHLIIREYLDGGSLWDRMKQPSQFAGARAVRTLLQVAKALDFAQGYQVHHGHLHPENILFDRDGQIKVVDFGGPVTCTKQMRRYFEKGPVDPGARDRFSLGVFLFEMLADRQYFASQGPDKNFEYFRDRKMEFEELKKLLRRLWNMVPKEERYANYKAVIEDLQRIRDVLAHQGTTLRKFFLPPV